VPFPHASERLDIASSETAPIRHSVGLAVVVWDACIGLGSDSPTGSLFGLGLCVGACRGAGWASCLGRCFRFGG